MHSSSQTPKDFPIGSSHTEGFPTIRDRGNRITDHEDKSKETSSNENSLQINVDDTEAKVVKVNKELDAKSSRFQKKYVEPEYTDWQKSQNGRTPVTFDRQDQGSSFLKKVVLIHISLRKKPRVEIPFTAENPRRSTRICTPSSILISCLEYESNEKDLKRKSAKFPKMLKKLKHAATGVPITNEIRPKQFCKGNV